MTCGPNRTRGGVFVELRVALANRSQDRIVNGCKLSLIRGSTATTGIGLWLDRTGTVSVRFGTVAIISVQRTLKWNRWSHVAISYDGERLSLLVDGRLRGTADWAGDVAVTRDVLIGFTTIDENQSYHGSLDGIALFDHGLQTVA